MQHATASCVPLRENPAFKLGASLGILGQQGRDKVTFIVEPPLEALGMWLEQLLAESTGKEGRGLLPVANEALGKPNVYGPDRLFVHILLKGQANEDTNRALQALQDVGHPVIRIELSDRLDLGQEFLRWEIAVAVAGSILGVNAFDQPNVQESKDNTQRLLHLVQQQGRLTEESPLLSEGSLRLYTQMDIGPKVGTLSEALNHWLSMAYPGYYIALMAYFRESPETEKMLQGIRQHLRDRQRLATTLGYGPRFLHSTGQYHKGGPNSGLFLQLTVQDSIHIPIPARPYDFSVFKQAEAQGDLQSLQQHGRKVIRIDLGGNPLKGLTQLQQTLSQVVFSRI
jgi:hypothetical protein